MPKRYVRCALADIQFIYVDSWLQHLQLRVLRRQHKESKVRNLRCCYCIS